MSPLRVQDDSKLGELILYISGKSAGDARFGSTKLNKLLYFSDFLAYGKFGEPITCAVYRHLVNGPAPRDLEEIRDGLIAVGALRLEERKLDNERRQIRPVALRAANTDNFSAKQIELVGELIRVHWDRTADEISLASHNYVGWKMTKNGETIPYETIFLSDAPLTPEEIYRGQELARLDSRWALVA
jgi:hypothetical protein